MKNTYAKSLCIATITKKGTSINCQVFEAFKRGKRNGYYTRVNEGRKKIDLVHSLQFADALGKGNRIVRDAANTRNL